MTSADVVYDHVAFDLDGTLVDSRADLTAAVNHVLRGLGLAELPPATLYRYVGDGARVLVERALGPEHQDRLEAAVEEVAAARPSVTDAPLALVQVPDLADAVALANAYAPEHLQLMSEDAYALAAQVCTAGCVFVGRASGTAFGDYAAGSNHVLPTGGTARSKGGLSVYTFLRVRTWLRIDDPVAARPLVEDAAWFGRVEGLEAHARSAERRLD